MLPEEFLQLGCAVSHLPEDTAVSDEKGHASAFPATAALQSSFLFSRTSRFAINWLVRMCALVHVKLLVEEVFQTFKVFTKHNKIVTMFSFVFGWIKTG